MEERIDRRKALWVGPLAAVIAVVVNVVIYGVGRATGVLSDSVLIPANSQPLAMSAVILLSFMGTIFGTIAYLLLSFVPRRPITLFRIIGVAVLLLSLLGPLGLAGAGFGYILTLELMHIVTAAVCIGLLTTMARA